MKLTLAYRQEKNTDRTTAVWRNGGCSASYGSLVVGSSAVLRLNFCGKNPPLRQAPKRWPYNVQIYPNIDSATRWVIMLYYGNDFVTGLQSDQGNQGFVKVYPNPAKDRLRLDFGEEKIYLPKTLHLYDSFGRLHQSIELAPGIVEVDINKLTQGIYTGVAMSQEKQLGVFKFIVY